MAASDGSLDLSSLRDTLNNALHSRQPDAVTMINRIDQKLVAAQASELPMYTQTPQIKQVLARNIEVGKSFRKLVDKIEDKYGKGEGFEMAQLKSAMKDLHELGYPPIYSTAYHRELDVDALRRIHIFFLEEGRNFNFYGKRYTHMVQSQQGYFIFLLLKASTISARLTLHYKSTLCFSSIQDNDLANIKKYWHDEFTTLHLIDDEFSRSPITLAASVGSWGAFNFIIKRCDTDLENIKECVFHAVKAAKNEFVEGVLNMFPEHVEEILKATNSFGRTPLHEAVLWQSFDVAKLLICRGATFDLLDASQKIPQAYCHTHAALINLFKGIKRAFKDAKNKNFAAYAKVDIKYGKEKYYWNARNTAGQTALQVLLND